MTARDAFSEAQVESTNTDRPTEGRLLVIYLPPGGISPELLECSGIETESVDEVLQIEALVARLSFPDFDTLKQAIARSGPERPSVLVLGIDYATDPVKDELWYRLRVPAPAYSGVQRVQVHTIRRFPLGFCPGKGLQGVAIFGASGVSPVLGAEQPEPGQGVELIFPPASPGGSISFWPTRQTIF